MRDVWIGFPNLLSRNNSGPRNFLLLSGRLAFAAVVAGEAVGEGERGCAASVQEAADRADGCGMVVELDALQRS